MPEGMEYWTVITTDDKGNKAIGGGLMKRQNPQQQGITNYIDVRSVDEYSSKVDRLGGKIVVPKMPVKGMGYVLIQKIIHLEYGKRIVKQCEELDKNPPFFIFHIFYVSLFLLLFLQDLSCDCTLCCS